MLHREALPSSTLDLLIQICAAPEYSAFGLAGGTALALRLASPLPDRSTALS